ncbi:amylo-alpha-1,6-glucosidase [Paenibacillus spiritus]|nr:amylo-alpha-1,6-glucosidase [Paenibacillus spiritus]
MSTEPKSANRHILDEMKRFIPAEANRGVSFTNKEAAYYYTQSHVNDHAEHAEFEGLHLYKRQIFGGYELWADGQKLDNRQAEVWVYPYKLERKHGALTEELWMFDYANVLEIRLAGAQESIGIRLKGEQVRLTKEADGFAVFTAAAEEWTLAVGSASGLPVKVQQGIVSSGGAAGGFYIAAAKTAEEAAGRIQDIRRTGDARRKERMQRMETFLSENAYLEGGGDSFALALNWLHITMDQLVTRQQGDGIYAGLPWFNEYWGRDQFISLPGAVLVTGQFETARNILLSFAKYQNTDETSRYFGRVPNILAPENIDYHTTDGTPRFIIQLQEYVKYSGDTAVIPELYPAVMNSIEGAIRNWTDDKGYLLHDDNETWMDARDAELRSLSPRDTRANDIQALWYHQLLAGVYFAEYMNDSGSAARWSGIADRLKRYFEHDYRDAEHDYLADRLDRNDQPEFSIRPNQLFALDMIGDRDFVDRSVRTAWEELVYPWGTASLDRHHPNFHPYHLTEDYHKDEAYHNGAVWLWLNGIAMQRMIEAGQEETAFELFKNMNHQALNLGVVGGLCENMDAYPREGQSWAKLTGAYLQAWSNAEQLRVWVQYFLGIRPDMINRVLSLAPRLPREIEGLQTRVKVSDGSIGLVYEPGEEAQIYTYSFNGVGITAVIDIAPFEVLRVGVTAGSKLSITRTECELTAELADGTGSTLQKLKSLPSSERLKRQQDERRAFEGVKFAEPLTGKVHPVMEGRRKRRRE